MRVFPEIVTVGRYNLNEQDFCYTYQSDTHALHVYEHHGRIKIAQKVYPISPGTITLTPSGIETSYDLPQPGYHYCIHFKPVPVRTAKRVELPLRFELGSLKSDAVHKIDAISRYQNTSNGDLLNSSAATVALQELLLWFASNSHHTQESQKGSRACQAVEQAASLLVQRLSQSLSVPDLAEEVGLSQNYLARHFRQRFGVSIPRYLLVRRMKHAKHLLLDTNIPIKEIAQRIGLPEPQHFYKQFRSIVGLSPTAFRLTKSRKHLKAVE